MNTNINSMLASTSVTPKLQPNQSQGSNAQFGSALQSALTLETDSVNIMDTESLTLSDEKLSTLKDLVDFLKQTSLSDLEEGIADEDLLINDSSSSGALLLQVLKGLTGDDSRLEDFFKSIDELDLNQEQEEEISLDSQSLLGANVMELYTILKQVASLSEEEWQQLPIEGTANLLKLVKVQELLLENKDITQDEASLQKQVKNVLEGITGKLEKWMSNEQQKKSGEIDFSVLVDKGQNKSLETVRNAFSRIVEAEKAGNKQGLGLPFQIVKPTQFKFTLSNNGQADGPAVLNTEENTNLNPNVPVQMSKIEQLVLTASKGGQTVNQDEFIKQFESILNKSNFSGTNGVNKLLIRLNPEHLGSLRIELIQKDGMMTARILAATAQAKDMLDNQVQGLKQAFSGQNVQIEKIEIAQTFNSFNSEKFSQKEAEDQSRQQQESKQESKEESDGEFTGSFAEALLNMEV
ncbi:flagellar hook-length control protein FliK [Peribacillus sp. NPDC097295]|uniref:flagellar hook-length control protein FliK n=1 Tax=Peribacillus sp. NPDC097295 TaxID=3364402 RepID=UPI0038087465